jgi:spore coat polysaccharide biosynthesis protein SpsF
MNVVGIIQARMGSTRLPGKVMLPLNGKHVIERDIERAAAAESIDGIVVATSTLQRDDIVETYARRSGASVYRGSESDVMGRMYEAAVVADADVVARLSGDCPLVSPHCIDAVVRRLVTEDADYAANTITRTLPRGLDVEVFTTGALSTAHKNANRSTEREHLTPYFRRSEAEITRFNVDSTEIFDDDRLQGRSDLRLTLDEAADYELLRSVYDGFPRDELIPVGDAIEYIDANGLEYLNRDVSQKSTGDDSVEG